MASNPKAKSGRVAAESGTPREVTSPHDTRPSRLSALFIPVDITPLVYFRIAFGTMMLWLGWQYFHGTDLVSGRSYNLIKYFYIDPALHFTYYGFDWVKPWSGNGMYVHCYVVGIAAALIIVGLFYRLASLVFCLGFTYLFLLDQARYLHHYYLICLLGLLLTFLPANRKFSLDALLRPKLRSNVAPAWTLWLLRLQFAVVYFYAGVAKCTPDWLRCEPVRTMLAYKQHRFPDASFLTQFFTDEWFVALVAYGGMIFDLAIVPLMLFRSTRWIALPFVFAFHLANTQLFDIDIFPWMMIAATLILFYPDLLPLGRTKNMHGFVEEAESSRSQSKSLSGTQRVTATLVMAYAAAQVLIPLRPFFYPGDTGWSDEGRKFSWRMLSRDIRPTEPPQFLVSFRKGNRNIRETFPFPKDMRFWLNDPQFSKMVKTPDLLLQFVHLQAENMRQQGASDIEVRVNLKMSLNGRKGQPYVDPNIDLAAEPRRCLSSYPWVMPLTEPFPDRKSESFDSAAPTIEALE